MRSASTLALAAFAVLLLACSSPITPCHPTAHDAATRILDAWCRRRVECGQGATVDACVTERLAVASVPTDEGCRLSCGDDASGCGRSTCTHDETYACAQQAAKMACSAMTEGALVRYPGACGRCF